MLLCTKCNEWKSDSEFYAKRRWCKPCQLAYYRKRHAEKVKDPAFVEAKREKSRAWRKSNVEMNARLNRRSSWKAQGIDPDLAEAYYLAHDGKCEICCKASNKALHMDHNHETGIIRGMLCSNCNRALGFLKDNPNTLQAAYDYLIR